MRGWIAALLVGLAVPATAQQSPATCEASWTRLSDALPVAVTAEISTEGPLCVATNVVANQSFAQTRIDRVTWEGQGLDRYGDEGVPPRSLVLTVERARSLSLTGDPRTDYVRRAQARQEALSGRLELRWDQLTNRLFLDMLNVDFPGESALRMSGQAGGVDLSSMSTLRTSLGSAVLSSLTVDVTMFGLFEAYLLERFVMMTIPSDTDPEAAMPEVISGFTRQIEGLPDTSFSADTKAAMIAFLEDVPSPSGGLRLTLAADPPLGWIRLFPNWLSNGVSRDPATLLEGVRIRVEYSPRSAPQ